MSVCVCVEIDFQFVLKIRYFLLYTLHTVSSCYACRAIHQYIDHSSQLHNCHNSYVLAIKNADTHQYYYKTVLLPFTFDTFQERMEQHVGEWYVCVSVCLSVCLCLYIFACQCVYVHTYLGVHACIYLHVRKSVLYICVCVYACLCVYVYVYVSCVCVLAFIC